MTITPAELTAERLAQIEDASKLVKLALMHTVATLAAANADPNTVTIKPEAAGMISKLREDLGVLEELRLAYERKDGIFKDYIL